MTGSNPPDSLLGGLRHPDARDLTRYLVHTTWTAKNLVSILTMGKIEARNGFGIARTLLALGTSQYSACFAEIPPNELPRLTKKKKFGVAFTTEFIRSQGGQRVWYLDDGGDPAQAMQAQVDAAVRARDWTSPLWRTTPFMDRVIPGQYDFVWEREWRLPGGLTFDWGDVAFIVAPGADGTGLDFKTEPTIGGPWIDPDDWSVSWYGSSLEALDSGIEGLLERFDLTYMTADEASFPYSSADGGYQWLVEGVAYDDAIEELFGDTVTEHVKNALGEVISSRGWYWARRYDVEHIAD